MKPKTIFACVALAIGASALTGPAQAGQFSINLSPSNAEQHRLMQAGLGLYALANQIENGSIRQNGINNIAGIVQGGGRNLGIVHQDGNGHNGTLNQQGGGNSYGLFQFGKNTSAHVRQNGGQSGLGFVFGW